MQQDQYGAYRDYLGQGMRLEIGIPLSGGGVFRDWGVVVESGGDELVVQVSRDVLPANVRVDVGSILDVSVSVRKDEVYTCSGIVIDRDGGRVLRVRLFGNFTLRERRQFFRINLNLRVKYAPIEDGVRRDIEADWELRRDVEHMKFQGYDQFAIAAHKARFKPAQELDWRDMLWAETNLSGGGICMSFPERVRLDDLLALEIHLPLAPPRLVQAVAQVIHVMVPRPQKGGGTLFPAGMRFVMLDERDRDLLFRHISVSQIESLRTLADRRDLPAAGATPLRQPMTWRLAAVRALWAALVLFLAYYLGSLLVQYRRDAPPNEIQKTYEKAIRQYRHLGP